LILSKKRAALRDRLEGDRARHERGDPVDGRVIEVVKGGLILDLGVRGFLPASLVDIRRVQDLDEFLGQELRCKVIELNRSRNNVVLSRRAGPRGKSAKADPPGASSTRSIPVDVVEGTISNIVDFGAFVDLDGMDGLIHISELSWSHVNHPSEVLEIGQKVKVKVLDIDRERQRISLGSSRRSPIPWQQVLESYRKATSSRARDEGRHVRRVRRDPARRRGLVHISELAQHHVENPREVVSQGDAVNVASSRSTPSGAACRSRSSASTKGCPSSRSRRRGREPTIDLSENVFSDESAVSSDDAVEAGALDESGGAEPTAETVSSEEPAEGSNQAAPE
jgi:small subunit ribosomal protein S1